MKRITTFTLASLLAVMVSAQSPKTSTFTLVDHKSTTLTEAGVKSADAKPSGKVGPAKNTLQFSSSEATLFIHTGPDEDMLSYRIQSLRNPDLVLQRGAVLHILFANTDEDMFHDIRFGMQKPSGILPSTANTAGSEQLKHTDEETVFADQFTVQAPSKPGTYYYFCSMKGHAKCGMYGRILVR